MCGGPDMGSTEKWAAPKKGRCQQQAASKQAAPKNGWRENNGWSQQMGSATKWVAPKHGWRKNTDGAKQWKAPKHGRRQKMDGAQKWLACIRAGQLYLVLAHALPSVCSTAAAAGGVQCASAVAASVRRLLGSSPGGCARGKRGFPQGGIAGGSKTRFWI